MKKNDILKKLTTNNIILYFFSNLNYISLLLWYYNSNTKYIFEMFITDVLIITFLILIINSIIYYLIYKYIKDSQKVFYILFFFSFFYVINYNLTTLLIIILLLILFSIIFKKYVHFKLDSSVGLLIFIGGFLFLYNFSISLYNGINLSYKTRKYNVENKIVINNDLPSPNIYWIHTDGMMSINATFKYFGYKNETLNDYLTYNNYYKNDDAYLVSGHKTSFALASLFNPNYYDNFFSTYLNDLENIYLKKQKRTSFNISYDEVTSKRLDSELFSYLKAKDYKTIAISKFNQYSSLNSDYYYDFYNYNENDRHIEGDKKFKLLTNLDFNKAKKYTNYFHLKNILNYTVFHYVFDNINFLDYNEIDYNNIDTSSYSYIDNSKYWPIKAMLKGIELSNETDDKKFVFIDYDLNHLPITFDKEGNIIDKSHEEDINYYLDNYIYASYLLIDLLSYIKNNDQEAIIIVEADHGIHSYENDTLMHVFNISNDEAQNIKNSVMNAVYIPEKYKNGDEKYLQNPLNISRYLVNNFMCDNSYNYIEN